MPIHRHIRPQILERLNWQLGIKNLAPPEKLKTKPSIWRIHRRWSSREWKWKKTQFASRSWRPISPTLNATVGCYSTGNFRAATNFARLNFQTNPSIESQITIAISKANFASEWEEERRLPSYDYRNPFVVRKASLCAFYWSPRFVPSQKGRPCSVFELAETGYGASGLLCSHSQLR